MAPSSSRTSSLSHTLSGVTASLRDKLIGLASGPAIAIARPAVLGMLSSIEIGTLILVDEHYHERHVFGQPLESLDPRRGGLTVTLTITAPRFYTRLLLFADMGFAQSYLLHDATCSDLTAFFRLFILNRAHLNNGSTLLSSSLLLLTTKAWRRTMNTIDNALLNASAHYDLGNELFAAFLSADMTYSCPIWAPLRRSSCVSNSVNASGEQNGIEEQTLEEAQIRKLRRVIAAARIKRTDHVLEIGTGYGSLAIEAVKTTGCRVTTVTLSREQKAWADKRVLREGLADRIEVLLLDYRAIPPVPEGYDKIVSVEMVEAVGKEFLGTYFGVVHRLLKREGGMAVVQCITMPEGRQAAYEMREDFINRYIFPGGYLPSVVQLVNHIATESNGTLIVESVENVGGHYARALRLWRENFLINFDARIRHALLRKHPEMDGGEIEVFRRKWEYYFSYCEAGFLTKTLGDVIITVAREGTMELMEGIPL